MAFQSFIFLARFRSICAAPLFVIFRAWIQWRYQMLPFPDDLDITLDLDERTIVRKTINSILIRTQSQAHMGQIFDNNEAFKRFLTAESVLFRLARATKSDAPEFKLMLTALQQSEQHMVDFVTSLDQPKMDRCDIRFQREMRNSTHLSPFPPCQIRHVFNFYPIRFDVPPSSCSRMDYQP